MGKIMSHNSKIMDFDDNNKKSLINYCDSQEIKYIVNNQDILLFPKLYQKSFILKGTYNTESEKEFIKYIKNILINEGATVINGENFENKASLKHIDVQIIIVISFVEGDDHLTIYTSSDVKGTSDSVTKRLINKIISSDKIIKYKVANLLTKLRKMKYWTYLFSNPNPTLILEIPSSILYEVPLNNLASILANSIIEEFWDKEHYEEENKLIFKLKTLQAKQSNTSSSNLEDTPKKETLDAKSNETPEKPIEDIHDETTESLKNINNEDDNIDLASDNKKNDNNTNKHKEILKPKDEKNKSKAKKTYLPRIPANNISPLDLNKEIECPIIYPGEGPVHEFQRPKLDNKK